MLPRPPRVLHRSAIYGSGVDSALGIAAFFYGRFALAAGIHLVSTVRNRRSRAEQSVS